MPATVVDRCHRFDFQRPTRRADRERRAPRRRGGVDRDPARGASPRSRARPPAASATRSARSSSWSPTAAARSRSRTCSPCSASPTRELLEETLRRGRRGRRAPRRCSRVETLRRAGPRRGRVRRRPGGARARAAGRADARRGARRALADARGRRAPGRRRPRRVAHATRGARCSSCWRARSRRCARAPTPRTQLELALVKAARPEVDGSTRALLARIERLEAGWRRAGRVSACPRPRRRERRVAGREWRGPAPDAGARAARREASAPAAAATGEPAAATAPERRAGAGAASRRRRLRGRRPARPRRRDPRAARLDCGRSGPRSSSWSARAERAARSVDRGAPPGALDGEELTLAFAPQRAFLKKKAEDPGNRAAVSEALRAAHRQALRVSLRAARGARAGGRRGAELTEEELVRALHGGVRRRGAARTSRGAAPRRRAESANGE